MITWHDENDLDALEADPTLLYWLTEPQCLTEAIEAHSHCVKLQLLSMDFDQPMPDEILYLSPHHQSDRFIVRESSLQSDDTPWTYARVIIPEETYKANQENFDTLGDDPIGKTLLFQHDNITRSTFQCALLYQNVWQKNPYIAEPMEKQLGKRTLGMRRSIFFIDQKPLQITEVYFPSIYSLAAPAKIT
jgi:chorismate lyase